MEDNKPMDQEQAVTGADEQGQEENQGEDQRTFTQDEVNEIVQRRLDRERKKAGTEENTDLKERIKALEEREAAVLEKELKTDALDTLKSKGLPDSLLELVDFSSKEGYEASLKKVIDTLSPMLAEKGEMLRVNTGGTHNDNDIDTVDKRLRAAFGLK